VNIIPVLMAAGSADGIALPGNLQCPDLIPVEVKEVAID